MCAQNIAMSILKESASGFTALKILGGSIGRLYMCVLVEWDYRVTTYMVNTTGTTVSLTYLVSQNIISRSKVNIVVGRMVVCSRNFTSIAMFHLTFQYWHMLIECEHPVNIFMRHHQYTEYGL